jgi:SAM-dependent methyltransferase
LSLGRQPLANAYRRPAELDEPEATYPLTLTLCPGCGLAQLSETLPPTELFTDYPYFSSVSDAFVEHAGDLVERVVAERDLGPGSLAVEIGSNDGYLLRQYRVRDVEVLGVDPAANIAAVANERGIPTIAEFFGTAVAASIRSDGQLADVVHANNVIAHVPDLHDVVEGISHILKEDGIAIIETPYVRDMIERVEFDTIYHEHVFYYSLSSLSRVLEAHQLVVVDVERIPVHGGSIRVTATRASSDVDEGDSVAMLRDEEAEIGLNGPAYYREFASNVETARHELRDILGEFQAQGGLVAGYGAAAKGTVLLNAFGIGAETLAFVADRSPHKQGLYMPGVRVPIVSADELLRRRPDACLLLAWNFAEEILAQQAPYRAAGGRFIVPVPRPQLIG